jgi:FlgN protein
MDGNELSTLIAIRWAALEELLEISSRQIEVIRSGHMNELMRILSAKQQPLARLAEVAQRLRGAIADKPDSRQWASPSARNACRIQQEECEKMHLELLAIEAECETMLQQTRTGIQDELQRLEHSHQAAVSYAQSQARGSHPVATSGGRLDLSSDS